jgi:hypothetical protein
MKTGPTINCEFLPSYKEPIAGVIMPFGEAGSTDPCCRRRGSHSVYLTSRTARGVGSEIEGFDGGKISSLHSGILLRPRFIRGASRKVFRSRWTRGSSRNRAQESLNSDAALGDKYRISQTTHRQELNVSFQTEVASIPKSIPAPKIRSI